MSVASPLSVEPPWVVHELSSQWFLPATQVAERLGDLHRVVDGWVTAGTFVLAPPLYLGPPDHPVFLALAEHVRARHPDDRLVHDDSFDYWDDVGNPGKVQALVGLPADTLTSFPVRGRGDLLVEMQRAWGFGSSEREHELARIQLWLGTYGADVSGVRRPYEVAPLGSVGAVEKWLLSAPARLEPFGYAVSFDPASGGRWVGPHVRLDERAIVDLVGRVVRPLGGTEAGDLVVIDLAATAVGQPALDRLMRDVYSLRRRTASYVHGLLVADGVSVSVRRALWEQGFDYVSLSELGFRDYLAMHPDPSRSLDDADGALPHPTSLAIDLPA
ncbi:hypothetical protein ISU10_20465 [Nocardioides agariphilus]|jgi:hypothetical protein|uniref:Uncharacterized protein n=1 Tax=Nocardioides agariphilus TaxID=433664 RepID=A0A930VUI9_9ACTN|nr:hypothetical protein [Nocardioides agariphilus]MBF4770155.1 hypothetical protein [Nocardioides agariphilus]